MRILLIDDHTLFRQGLKYLLGDLDESLDFAEAGSCDEALGVLQHESVDLILLDFNLPGASGLDALAQVLDAAPGTPVSMLSGENDPGLIRSVIDAGASGFVPKDSSPDILVPALKLILAGGVYLPPTALSNLSQSTPPPANEVANLLSDRQTAVLLRAIQGQPNKVIAIELGIAEGTVKTHLSGAFRVLGVHNRTEAVFAAAKLGLVPEPTQAEAG